MPPITLWFLQASRSIRTAWLLEELQLPYTVKFFDRTPEGKAPQSLKEAAGSPLGKAPTIQDGDLTIYESGAITEYLCEKYDKENRLIPSSVNEPARVKVQQWIHASEATFALHGIAVLYARWTLPEAVKADGRTLEAMEAQMAGNVQNDIDWLEAELKASKGRFLLGDEVTAADIMMHFSLSFILARQLGTKGRSWPAVEKWLGDCEGTEGFRRAVGKTGHKM
ncbi:thioredoxin-like protein [Mytilinidion resinicola]|uniref:Thioredoxin-like protein n=1 Tax=Mytilinidion resinicola TaxID=574789 RepID=A0A6A6Z3T4_9PEZI|nr:thioredoxin-like protein [Mytilinidion resinicola]KAF2814917.1 thioredoxin-like protein [Mytilinidion resinicola]